MSSFLVAKNLKHILKTCPIEKILFKNNDIILIINFKYVYDFIFFLKNNNLTQYEILTCISGVDNPYNKLRFSIVYELLSIRFNNRIRIKTFVNEIISINSIETIYKTANWFECEIWDLFGVFFKNHSNLRRIMTDYGFEGFPLRKDFPLSGYIEIRYNEIQKRIINESLESAQKYRNFNFLSPWEKTFKI